MDDLRPEPISSNTSSPISKDIIEPNWIVKLFKDNLKNEIPSIVDCKLIFDILVKVRLQLRLRREESEKWLKLYNKQVEDDRHIENQRDELLEALDIALRHTDVGDSVVAYSCFCSDVCYNCEKAKRNIAEVSEARAIRDKIKLNRELT